MHAYLFKVAIVLTEYEDGQFGKADWLSQVDRNGQVGEGGPSSFMSAP